MHGDGEEMSKITCDNIIATVFYIGFAALLWYLVPPDEPYVPSGGFVVYSGSTNH